MMSFSDHPYLRVIKLGGSLLDWCDWPAAFKSWHGLQPHARDLLVVGGGRRVEAIRRLDADLRLGEVASHFLAVASMGVSARRVAGILDWRLVDSPRSAIGFQHVVIDAEAWMTQHAVRSHGQELPVSWQLTSDSIAAWIARIVRADELVLLKSCDAVGKTAERWASAGLVDSLFPAMSSELTNVGLKNLRVGIEARDLGRQ